MGTKNNPGMFDCYANAEPDEPMFILLGRDPNAPSLVDAWAAARHAEGESEHKVQEALDCAVNMRLYLANRNKPERQAMSDRLRQAEDVIIHLYETDNYADRGTESFAKAKKYLDRFYPRKTVSS